jgi:hypothetical protein
MGEKKIIMCIVAGALFLHLVYAFDELGRPPRAFTAEEQSQLSISRFSVSNYNVASSAQIMERYQEDVAKHTVQLSNTFLYRS